MDNVLLVEKFLAEELNLSRKEIKLYLNLTTYGPTTVLELAGISGINRATTHVNIENLSQKGLVTQIKKGRGSRRLIMAEPAEKLPILFKERKAKVEAAESQLDFIMREITGLKKEHRQSSILDVRRFVGKDEIKLIYDDVLKAKEIRTYLNYKELMKIFPANTMKFLNAQKKRYDMYMWEIMEDSKEVREYVGKIRSKRYHCKLTTQKLNLTSLDYMLFDGKIAIIDLAEGTNVKGIVIENDTFYENTRTIHKFVWELLPPYE